jgi:predicted amidohydrolase YtcJ
VTVEQSLHAYTVANAYAGFQEDRLGRIAPGFLADIAVLDADPTAIDPEKLPKVEVLRTFVGGRERFTAASA